jgi:hypothetical protein
MSEADSFYRALGKRDTPEEPVKGLSVKDTEGGSVVGLSYRGKLKEQDTCTIAVQEGVVVGKCTSTKGTECIFPALGLGKSGCNSFFGKAQTVGWKFTPYTNCRNEYIGPRG